MVEKSPTLVSEQFKKLLNEFELNNFGNCSKKKIH